LSLSVCESHTARVRVCTWGGACQCALCSLSTALEQSLRHRHVNHPQQGVRKSRRPQWHRLAAQRSKREENTHSQRKAAETRAVQTQCRFCALVCHRCSPSSPKFARKHNHCEHCFFQQPALMLAAGGAATTLPGFLSQRCVWPLAKTLR
jgi:hypothetical protein